MAIVYDVVIDLNSGWLGVTVENGSEIHIPMMGKENAEKAAAWLRANMRIGVKEVVESD